MSSDTQDFDFDPEATNYYDRLDIEPDTSRKELRHIKSVFSKQASTGEIDPQDREALKKAYSKLMEVAPDVDVYGEFVSKLGEENGTVVFDQWVEDGQSQSYTNVIEEEKDTDASKSPSRSSSSSTQSSQKSTQSRDTTSTTNRTTRSSSSQSTSDSTKNRTTNRRSQESTEANSQRSSSRGDKSTSNTRSSTTRSRNKNKSNSPGWRESSSASESGSQSNGHTAKTRTTHSQPASSNSSGGAGTQTTTSSEPTVSDRASHWFNQLSVVPSKPSLTAISSRVPSVSTPSSQSTKKAKWCALNLFTFLIYVCAGFAVMLGTVLLFEHMFFENPIGVNLTALSFAVVGGLAVIISKYYRTMFAFAKLPALHFWGAAFVLLVSTGFPLQVTLLSVGLFLFTGVKYWNSIEDTTQSWWKLNVISSNGSSQDNNPANVHVEDDVRIEGKVPEQVIAGLPIQKKIPHQLLVLKLLSRSRGTMTESELTNQLEGNYRTVEMALRSVTSANLVERIPKSKSDSGEREYRLTQMGRRCAPSQMNYRLVH